MSATNGSGAPSNVPANDSFGGNAKEMLAIQARFHNDLDLVEIVAKQVLKAIDGAVQLDELIAAGQEGLFDAARRFDPDRGIPFRAYANYRVEGAIIDTVRRTMRLPRRAHERLEMLEASSFVSQGEQAAALQTANAWYADRDPEVRLDDQLATIVTSALMSSEASGGSDGESDGDQPANPEEAYERAELMALVRSAMADLDEYEAKAISLYYFEGKTHDEAAEAMKVAKSWAHRLHTRALERLTKRLRQMIRD
jgi:RNA polymerase sigma factor for flagellar operon FliA